MPVSPTNVQFELVNQNTWGIHVLFYGTSKYYNTGNTSIVNLYNTRNTSIVMLQYW